MGMLSYFDRKLEMMFGKRIDDFVAQTKTQVVEYIPRSIMVTQSELLGKTTIEAAPNSDQAEIYRSPAKKSAGHTDSWTPSPLETAALREWAGKWGDYLLELEQGKVSSPGAAI